jgi:hypothetical protein
VSCCRENPVNRNLSDVLADLTDTEILSLSNLQMEPDQDARLSELLEKQQERSLSANEPQKLEGLMQ